MFATQKNGNNKNKNCKNSLAFEIAHALMNKKNPVLTRFFYKGE
jgi:hypothetical protein